MKICVVKERNQKLYSDLMNIWESSVKATHTFLSSAEIEKIKSFVPQALQNIQTLVIVEKGNSTIAFMGINDKKIEMLFVNNENRGQGFGKALINYAVNNFEADKVTVNEQNLQARGFYEHLGFKTYKRSEFDEQGNAYPILYMKLDRNK